jgi:2-methylisocitrate lyase-like PEP mutase family enzyme
MADTLRTRLAHKPIVIAPGVYDALTAHLAEQAGFATLYVSGAAIAYTRLGRPDIGLVSMSEVADTVSVMRDRVGAHLVVDADTGYGNALNVARTMRLFERAGANAIQLEDQGFPKRCGHFDDKILVPAEEMRGKIKAALDARDSADTLVIARTDAIAVEGFERAIERAALYRDAGADVLFVEAPTTHAELERIPSALPGVRLMANMVEAGKTPPLPAAELEGLGFALVIFPGGIVRALARTAGEYYACLAAHGTSAPFRGRMLDFAGLNEVIGTPAMLALGKRYESTALTSLPRHPEVLGAKRRAIASRLSRLAHLLIRSRVNPRSVGDGPNDTEQ